MAAALVNGFLTDFGVLRDNNPAQRIDPQEIASEKVRVSTKLKQGGNAEVQSVNQSISHLETSVEAVVEDSVVVMPQTDYDPAEWGAAMCRGSFYLCEDDVMPATDAGMRRLLSERINNWELVDCSDWADDG